MERPRRSGTSVALAGLPQLVWSKNDPYVFLAERIRPLGDGRGGRAKDDRRKGRLLRRRVLELRARRRLKHWLDSPDDVRQGVHLLAERLKPRLQRRMLSR